MLGRALARRLVAERPDREQAVGFRPPHHTRQPAIDALVATLPVRRPVWLRHQRQVEACLGPGQRHVVQPLLFLGALPLGVRFPLLRGVEVEHAAVAVVVEGWAVRASREAATHEDNGGLEPLALVDGHDLHGRTIGLEALDVTVLDGGLARFVDIAVECSDQFRQSATRTASLFEQEFEKVEVIRQLPLITLEKELAEDNPTVVKDPRKQALEPPRVGQVLPCAQAFE